jgi:septal ring factor EnvC (AmiA/AmiB activator)
MKSSDTVLWAIILMLLAVCAFQYLSHRAVQERQDSLPRLRREAAEQVRRVRETEEKLTQLQAESAREAASAEKWRLRSRELEHTNSQLREDLRRSATEIRELHAALELARQSPAK